METKKRCKNCGEIISGKSDWILCPFCNGELEDYEEPSERTVKVDTTPLPPYSAEDVMTLPQGIRVFFEVLDGPSKGIIYEFKKGKVVVGRKDADLVIKDPKVSKKHLSVEIWSKDIAYIQDLSSLNGTYLNGVKITKTRLKNGDIIDIGDSRLRFLIKEK